MNVSSLQTVTTSLVRGSAEPKTTNSGLTARLALDDATQADAYSVRHASYLSGGYIDPQPGQMFSDADDLRPNSRSVVVYKFGRPVASVRLCDLNLDTALSGFDEIPASRIFPEAVARLTADITHGRPAKLTEINRLVRHPDFATDYELVFVLFRVVGFMVAAGQSDMTLSCVRRNHTPFYKRMHFQYIDGPRRYAGVKFETNLMACFNAQYEAVAQNIPFIGSQAGAQSAYNGLLQGESIHLFSEG
jgi:hypothetical protein